MSEELYDLARELEDASAILKTLTETPDTLAHEQELRRVQDHTDRLKRLARIMWNSFGHNSLREIDRWLDAQELGEKEWVLILQTGWETDDCIIRPEAVFNHESSVSAENRAQLRLERRRMRVKKLHISTEE